MTMKLKLSEAMRKGLELAPNAPQTNGNLILLKDEHIVGYCAEGCALLGALGRGAIVRLGNYAQSCYKLLDEQFDSLDTTLVVYDGEEANLERLIWDWNDKEKVSIREIADRLEKLGF